MGNELYFLMRRPSLTEIKPNLAMRSSSKPQYHVRGRIETAGAAGESSAVLGCSVGRETIDDVRHSVGALF